MSNSLEPVDRSLPVSPIHGILQVGILEWVATLSFGGSSRPRNQTLISCGSCIAGKFFTTSITWEALCELEKVLNCYRVDDLGRHISKVKNLTTQAHLWEMLYFGGNAQVKDQQCRATPLLTTHSSDGPGPRMI